MTDITLYDNFKKQLVEYGDLAVQVYNKYKLVSVMNDYDDETGQFKNSDYMKMTRTLYENGYSTLALVEYIVHF